MTRNIRNKTVRSVEDLILENEALNERNEFLEKLVRALKENNAVITAERNALCDEIHRITSMGMFEFGSKYCDDNRLEDAGRQFARELLGGA